VVGSYVARPLGLAITGPVGEVVGYSQWLGIVAGVMFGSTLLALLVPGIRHLERQIEPDDRLTPCPSSSDVA
jgi:hypothetical protein